MEEKVTTRKFAHLTSEQRHMIQDGLTMQMTFKAIAKMIDKDQTTVSKEVKKHAVAETNQKTVFDSNGTPKQCPKLLKAPFVCNGCKTRFSCNCERRFYRYNHAQMEYDSLLSEARSGVYFNRESFYRADDIISSGLKNGQHIYHIVNSNELGMSMSSVYRHINSGNMTAGRIDLPRAVKFKQRHKYREAYVPRSLKVGRTFEDFTGYIEENEIYHWIEMDTLVGEPGGKVIITFDFTICNFMFGLLSDDKTAGSVTRQIRGLKVRLEKKGVHFGDFFPLILTDNGSEFSNFKAVEEDVNGVPESRLFFCDPYCSSQKPHVEKNHTLFRDICPKGTSFNSFTQADVNLIFSHVNCIKRKKLQGKTPYEFLNYSYDLDLADLLDITYIPADSVLQSPKLLKLLNHTI